MNLPALLALLQLAAPAPGAGVVALKPYDPVQTAAGKVTREQVLGEDQPLRLVLDGEKILYKRDGELELSDLLPQLNAAGDDALLLEVKSDEPSEQACSKYVFVVVHKDGTAQASEPFGDCSTQFTVERVGEKVTVSFRGKGQAWALQDGKVAPVEKAAGKKSGKKKH
jgi:hypothetical protein